MTTFEKYIDILSLVLNYLFAVDKLRTSAPEVVQASSCLDLSPLAETFVFVVSGEKGSTGIDLASKARSAQASKVRAAEVWPGPPLNL
eukprot:3460339-Pleurochrysis_carterae.AAC.1